MSFANGRACQTIDRRQKRLGRAQWWFQRMRQVVERATDWTPAPIPPAEQIWFAGANRQVAIASPSPQPAPANAKLEEQQVCE